MDKNRGVTVEMIRGFQESGQSSRAERVDLQGGWEGRNVTRYRIFTCSEPKGTTGEASSYALESTLAYRLGKYAGLCLFILLALAF